MECDLCPVGYFCESEGTSEPRPCSEGFYQDIEGSNECKICSTGRYQPFVAQTFCVECSPGYFQNMEGGNGCKLCTPGYYCEGFGTSEPSPCNQVDGLQQYCVEGSVSPRACPAGHFCQSSTKKAACSAGSDLCPRGSSHKRECPDGHICSLEIPCADSTTQDVWFNDARPASSNGTSSELNNLPDCSNSTLKTEIQAAGIVKLAWTKFDCSNFNDAFEKNYLMGIITRSYTFGAIMFSTTTEDEFSATMKGTLDSMSFSSFFNVPLGETVRFGLEMSIVAAVDQTNLCVIKSQSLNPVPLTMPFMPPAVSSVNATVFEQISTRVLVAWTLEGSVEVQEAVVAFDVFVDRNINGIFLEIDKIEIRVGKYRSTHVDLVAGYQYQFRVKPYNSQFEGGPSHPSTAIQIRCPSGNEKHTSAVDAFPAQ